MYVDFPPCANSPVPKVVVIERRDKTVPNIAEKVMLAARKCGAVTDDGGPMYWVVFEDQPRRMWDCTEKALRESIAEPWPERK